MINSDRILQLAILLCPPIIGVMAFLVTTSFAPKVPTATINIETAPKSTQVTLDGNKVGKGEINISVGNHRIEVQKKGFKSQSEEFMIEESENKNMGFVLDTEGDKTSGYYAANPKENQLAEAIIGRRQEALQSKSSQDNSLLQLLPTVFGAGSSANSSVVQIDTGVAVDNSTQTAIYIKAGTVENRLIALEWIKGQGYNPGDMDIVFTDMQQRLIPDNAY